MASAPASRHPSKESFTSNVRQRNSARASTIDVTEGLRSLMIESEIFARSQARSHSSLPSRYKRPVATQNRGSGLLKPPQGPQRPELGNFATGPPGSIEFFEIFPAKPQPLRRAISAPIAGPQRGQECRIRQRSSTGSPLRGLSRASSPEARSLIHHRSSSVKSKQKPRGLVWKVVPPETQQKYETISDVLEDRRGTSFSDKLRVKETLKERRVRALDTNIVDFKQRGLPITPTSLESTPKELYRRATTGRATTGRPTHPTNEPLLPASTINTTYLAVPGKPTIRERRISSRVKKCTTTGPRVYVSGPIKMFNAQLATLEPFFGTIGNDSKRSTDDDVLDEIAAFFQSFGIISKSAADELDRYWDTDSEVDSKSDSDTATEPDAPQAGPEPDRGAQDEDEDDDDDDGLPKFSSKALKTLGLDDPIELAHQAVAATPTLGALRSPSLRSAPTMSSIASESSKPGQKVKLRRFLGLPG